MVKIRLRRTGAKKQPSYRIVVTDSRSPRDGRFIEIIGHYNPRTEPVTVNIQEDRILHWLTVGAQMSETVQKLLKNMGTLDRFARLKQGADLQQLLAEAEASRTKNTEEAETQPPKAKKKAGKQAEAEVTAQVETAAPEATAQVETAKAEATAQAETAVPEATAQAETAASEVTAES
ncbi:MAG: 30S ribosomal protein S16 [Dehalococcoidia bacterium]|nr:MAG: 30S ribosomal protein S16 [Dehalococcoidia bacterium]